MNKYLATVRIGGQLIKTIVFADSSIHARLILQYQLGLNAVSGSPALVTSGHESAELFDNLIKNIKPLSPEQARLKTLQRNVQRDKDQLKNERDRQRVQKDLQKQRLQPIKPH